MVNEAADHAVRIEQYKEEHGIDRVERLMDAAFAIDRHIDPHKGVYREEYPKRTAEVAGGAGQTNTPTSRVEGVRFSQVEEVKGGKIPRASREGPPLVFGRYAPLDEWERDVFEIVREESHYFYPQFNTKIINEGWASYWHAEVINRVTGNDARRR